jgi:hypothetical protein
MLWQNVWFGRGIGGASWQISGSAGRGVESRLVALIIIFVVLVLDYWPAAGRKRRFKRGR